MTMLNAVTVAVVLMVACPIALCSLAFWLVCAAGKRDQLTAVDDLAPFEDVPLWHESSGSGRDNVSPSPSPTLREESIPVPSNMIMFRGGLVHTVCLTRWLRGGALTDGCKVHLADDVQTGAK